MAAARLSLDLLQRAVRGRDQLGWTAQETAEALDLTLWRVKDVWKRADAGLPLRADGKHRKTRASTKLTAAAKKWIKDTLAHSPRMHSDELAFRLYATLPSDFTELPCVDTINKAVRAMGFTNKLASRASMAMRAWQREEYWRTVYLCYLPEQFLFTDETYVVRGGQPRELNLLTPPTRMRAQASDAEAEHRAGSASLLRTSTAAEKRWPPFL